MSFDKSLETEIEIFAEEQAREIVIDYVQTHPGCSKEEIWRKQNKIGKKKLTRILPALIEEGIIIEGNPIGRKKPLFVKEANPYTVVLNELKNFEKHYFSIMNKSIDAYKKGRYLGDYEKPSCDSDIQDLAKAKRAALMWQPIHIFYEFLQLYMIRLITNWSKEIKEKDVLQKVNNMVFAKFTRMRIDTYKKMNSVAGKGKVGSASIGISYMTVQMNAKDRLNEKLKILKKYDMGKEAKDLAEFIEGFVGTEETRSYFRRKEKLYRWDLYKKEDIEELAEYMYRHQDYIYDGYYSDNMRSKRGSDI
jgi:hypothetical protein